MTRTLIVGIAGGSASGKTTLARALCDHTLAIGSDLISQDDYYHGLPAGVDAGNYNFDDPAALDLNRLADDLAQLKAGCAVRTPVYDFTLHRRAPALRELAPRALVVVEGLFLFVPPALRAVFDLRCFVDVPAAERLRRRLQRDTRERGRSEQDVLRQWRDQVEPMYERHALPTRAHADLVLTLPSADPAACAAQTAAVFALVDERLRRSIVAG